MVRVKLPGAEVVFVDELERLEEFRTIFFCGESWGHTLSKVIVIN